MNTFGEVTNLIRRLREPEQRELLAWLTESLDDSWRVAETAPQYGRGAASQETFTVEEYLALEESSDDRHEYVAGQIYAMSETLQPHKIIAGNVFASLHGHLRGTPCRPYIQSTRVHIRARGEDYFYYPDILVAGGQARDEKERFIDEHRLVMEVMSRSTERIDRREKVFIYRELPSIEEIVLISQKSPLVTLYRRTDDWAPVILASLEQPLELQSIDLALPLRQIYEGLP
ncbi:MAG TPA: Uma2 family endonuclease [Steroidobacteraceae bacterium]|jgi:Uma2 family endonuclease|nr:Uma2 family endonuclease [Steroidobacteraceae bacterium]